VLGYSLLTPLDKPDSRKGERHADNAAYQDLAGNKRL